MAVTFARAPRSFGARRRRSAQHGGKVPCLTRHGGNKVWSQVYDPLGSPWLSTLVAALPVVVLLGGLGVFQMKAHIAALAGLAVALAGRHLRASACRPSMARQGRASTAPPSACCRSAGSSSTSSSSTSSPSERGLFEVLQDSITRHHRRPAAAAAAHRLLLRRLLRGRGRLRHAGRGHRRDADRPGLLAARGLGPVADRQHGAGRLRRARHAGHRAGRGDRARPPASSAAMVGRQLPFFSLIVPFWLIVGLRRLARHAARSGRRSWSPACSFAIPQFLVSNFHGPWLVDVVAVAGVDGLPRALPERLAAERHLDLDRTPRGLSVGPPR